MKIAAFTLLAVLSTAFALTPEPPRHDPLGESPEVGPVVLGPGPVIPGDTEAFERD
ncbi:uncharacterized protein ACHE_60524A [Aspergillus chevalieri]|uniref:Uncharacterized protein n=1 Tax=Aspergillus chevalieri TaxID=182096 RepID=A0A7R7VUX3_ASPCH|nr:uncharacterized protein ACHE_60524A [Aspergillus chevalieri]BCR90638.1 hypothetical protein ACHE_60524A [Aspergillus chevalieri]